MNYKIKTNYLKNGGGRWKGSSLLLFSKLNIDRENVQNLGKNK